MIYLDHNATSPPTQNHLEKLFSVLQNCAGNPSSPHSMGRNASVALTKARRAVAVALGVEDANLIFTSGASEANNMATAGVLRYLNIKQSHAITSAIEHPSVLEPLEYLQKTENLNLTKIAPNSHGFLCIEEIIKNINEKTNYISIMVANNEVGSIQPVQLLGDFLHYKRWGLSSSLSQEKILELENILSDKVTKEILQKLHFHVDAVQAFGKIKQEQWLSAGFDSIAVSGHKLGALQGVGALFLRRGRKFYPLILGGAQEKNRRAGTENLPGIVSFGLVCEELLENNYWDKVSLMNNFKNELYENLCSFASVTINSPSQNALPNTINFSYENALKNGEDILLQLDLKGVCASSGSACSSGANLPSKILIAMKKSVDHAKNAVRISLSTSTTVEEIKELTLIFKDLL